MPLIYIYIRIYCVRRHTNIINYEWISLKKVCDNTLPMDLMMMAK